MTTASLRGWPANPGDDALLLLSRTSGRELSVPIRAVARESGTTRVVLLPGSAEGVRALVRLSRARQEDGRLERAGTRSGREQIIREPGRIARVLSMLHEAGRLDIEHLPEPGTLVQADGPFSLFRFSSPEAGRVPAEIEQVTRRAQRRVKANPRLRVRATHPVHPEISINRTVRDLSLSGLSFWSRAVEDAVWPGLELDFELTVRHEARADGRGIVRHVSDFAGRQLVGLEVLEMDDVSRSEVLEALYPTAALFGADDNELWQLYSDSGYFGLSDKKPEDFAPYRASFSAMLAVIEQHPDACAGFTSRTRSDLNTSAHQLQMWERGWLGYQGCRSQARPSLGDLGNENLVATYGRSYEHIAFHGADWIVTYVQQAARWARAVNYEVALPWIGLGLASVTPFTAVEMRTSSLPASEAAVTVRDASKDERTRLARLIAEVEATPYIQATGLTEDALDGAMVERWWKMPDLMRRRTTRVAILDGQPAAFSVLDATDPGLHLFQLTNACRIFALEASSPTVVAALLNDAAQWFCEAGLDRFVYFAAPEGPRPEGDGVLSLGDAWVTVVSAELTPLYVERIIEVASAIHPLLSEP